MAEFTSAEVDQAKLKEEVHGGSLESQRFESKIQQSPKYNEEKVTKSLQNQNSSWNAEEQPSPLVMQTPIGSNHQAATVLNTSTQKSLLSARSQVSDRTLDRLERASHRLNERMLKLSIEKNKDLKSQVEGDQR